jgi:hypothetical protein
VTTRFVPWKDNLVRRLLGFSPFELEDEIRRLRKLVEDLRREHAEEISRLEKALAQARGEGPTKSGDVVRLPIRTA